jgi:hypothetical protein
MTVERSRPPLGCYFGRAYVPAEKELNGGAIPRACQWVTRQGGEAMTDRDWISGEYRFEIPAF